MLQDPLLPINVGYGAPATRRVGVTGVVGHQAKVVFVDLDLPEVHGTDRAVFYLDFVTLARPVVRDRETLGPRGGRTPPVTRALRLFGQPLPLSFARTLSIYARATYVSASLRLVRYGYYHAPERKRKVTSRTSQRQGCGRIGLLQPGVMGTHVVGDERRRPRYSGPGPVVRLGRV